MHDAWNEKDSFWCLLLLNAFVWPKWLGPDGWISFVAILMVVGGFLMLIVPQRHENCCAPEPVKSKKAPARRKKR